MDSTSRSDSSLPLAATALKARSAADGGAGDVPVPATTAAASSHAELLVVAAMTEAEAAAIDSPVNALQ